MRLIATVAIAALAFAGSADARSHKHKPAPQPGTQVTQPAGQTLNEYMFSLSWEPAFCRTHQDKTECGAMKPDSYDAHHLVLHGLWPQPQSNQYCGVSDAIRHQDENHQWEQMPEIKVTGATRTRMDKLFPGVVSYLDRHEWYKHGTCSGMDPDGYFNMAMDLVEQANGLKFGQLVSANIGKTVQIDDLCGALTHDFGSGFVRAVYVAKPNSDLGEIRIALKAAKTADLKLDADHLTAGGGSLRCTGTIKVDSVGRSGS